MVAESPAATLPPCTASQRRWRLGRAGPGGGRVSVETAAAASPASCSSVTSAWPAAAPPPTHLSCGGGRLGAASHRATTASSPRTLAGADTVTLAGGSAGGGVQVQVQVQDVMHHTAEHSHCSWTVRESAAECTVSRLTHSTTTLAAPGAGASRAQDRVTTPL